MIFDAVSRAIAQLPDPRFRGVLLRGIGITLGALIAAVIVVFNVVGWMVGDDVSLPWIGTVQWLDDAASWASVPVMLLLSVFLMTPVASAIISMFLEEVAQAVEDRHYPGLPAATQVSFSDGLMDALGFFGTMVLANILALIVYLIFIPFAPFIFWALNGFLLGREYFTLAAMRRVGRVEARKLRRRHLLTIWVTGVVMAVPLTVPILNLLVPVLGAAAFTHVFHRVNRAR
ncbi:EI24 domain-containing protein [Mameliella sp. CS4]|uniref:EI24 domain-containing protein n=1 Tax=Mameliella sp. CS4 TaxID=2862329 RepID=UPI001C5DF8AE|nr:EI24 domain-containing protein [Mameliella sp. CS4]MBW4981043.1 EI24 domain-containing protein [Mameliella sp. CS4]